MKKSILKILLRYEKVGVRTIQAFLIFCILIRLVSAIKTAEYVDTRYFIETSKLILQGISPYHPETNPTKYIYPAQAPSMSLICMPLCIFPDIVQNLFFFFAGTIAFIVFTALVFNYFGFSIKKHISARWSNLPIWLTFTMICISSPFLMMLRHGQNSSLAALCLFIVLFYPSRDKGVINIIMLGLAAALKYSLMTMEVPILVMQRRWRISILGFLLFVVLVLSVGLWLDGIVPAFREYIQLLLSDAQHGANSYANVNSFAFVHIGFFKSKIVNMLLQIIMIIMYFSVICGIWWNRRVLGTKCFDALTAAEWALFTTMTLLISYHREYDGVLFMPFLGVVFLESIYNKEHFLKISWMFVVLCFWSMPKSIVYKIEAWIGGHFPAAEIVFLKAHHPGMDADMLFPLTKLMVLTTAFYLFAIVIWRLAKNDRRINGAELPLSNSL